MKNVHNLKNLFAASTLIVLLLSAMLGYGQAILLTNAKLVDPASQSISEDLLLIEDGRIKARLKTMPDDASLIKMDLQGQYVIPGLIDMHTHSWGNAGIGGQMEMLMSDKTAERMLYCGVTSYLDLFSEENYIFDLRDKQRKEGLTGADIYCAGPILTCTGGHGAEYGIPTRIINTPEEAREQVRDLAKKNPDVVKIVYDNAHGRLPTIDKATMEACIDESNKLGLKTVIHIGTWEDIIESVEAGATAVTHTPDEPMPESVIQVMKEKGAYIIPTLGVQSELLRFSQNPSLLDHPLLQGAVNPSVINSFRDSSSYDPRAKAFMKYQKRSAAHIFKAVKRLADAGIPVLTGTDAGNPGVFQGYSVHREMQLLKEAGLSNWEILASATTQAGKFLGQAIGLNEGDIANLVILAGSPIEDLDNATRIVLAMMHGQIVDRSALGYREIQSSAMSNNMVDDFSTDAESNWTSMTDEIQGGGSKLHMETTDGILRVHGNLSPGQRMPFAWTMISKNLAEAGGAADISSYEGVKIRIQILKGFVYMSMTDTRVTNYDYPMYIFGQNAEWQEIDIPFASLKQNYTQPPLEWDGKSIQSMNLGSNGQQAGEFEFLIDRIEFY